MYLLHAQPLYHSRYDAILTFEYRCVIEGAPISMFEIWKNRRKQKITNLHSVEQKTFAYRKCIAYLNNFICSQADRSLTFRPGSALSSKAKIRCRINV